MPKLRKETRIIRANRKLIFLFVKMCEQILQRSKQGIEKDITQITNSNKPFHTLKEIVSERLVAFEYYNIGILYPYFAEENDIYWLDSCN